jgi:large subunit ribosomal protein L18
MKKLIKKQKGLKHRHTRVRGKVSGTHDRPRMCVTRSNNSLYVQFIDDISRNTLCGVSCLGKEFRDTKKRGSNVEGAKELGKIAADKAKKAGISKVVFDRGGNLYHGRIKALADGAREGGLIF